MPQQSKDEDSSTTYATISAGNINIGGKETTVEALGIHSDINTANQKVNDLPDLQAVLDKQKIIADATSTIATAGRTYSQDQIKKAVQEKEALQGELKTQLSPEEQAKIKNYTIKQKDEYFAGNPEYAAALANEKTVTEKWGMGGDYSRGLNAVTTALTAVLGGQTDLQAATNTLAPYAAQVIGQQWGHGEDKNTAAQLAAHAILGATLAYINGGDPTAGGSAAVASEAAATYFTNQYKDKKEYQDANGVFQPNLLPEDIKTQIRDLTVGIGAVIGGAVGDSTYNAQLAGVIGQNAVENNVLETVWDVANVAIGANSLTYNIKDGNYAGALLDAGGLVYDGVAAVIPVLPAGASVIIKSSRSSGEILHKLGDVVNINNIEHIRVGRWMSAQELDKMQKTGKVQDGAGSQTFISLNGSNDFKGAAQKGSVYIEFDVPKNSLIKGGKDGWFKMIGPNASKSQKMLLNKQGGSHLPSIQNLKIVDKK